jgi:hypothetical protein
MAVLPPGFGAAVGLSLALPLGVALLTRARWLGGAGAPLGEREPRGAAWWSWIYFFVYISVLGPVFLVVVGLAGLVWLESLLLAR